MDNPADFPYVIAYRGEFVFPLPPDALWRAIGRFDRFESWWGWLADFEADGVLQRGTVLRGTVAPPVPFRMRVEVALLDCEPPHRLVAAVAGDLRGQATLDVTPHVGGAQPSSRVLVQWEVEMMQRPMRVAARVAYPVLRWGHDRVVEAAVAGFRRQLARDRDDR